MGLYTYARTMARCASTFRQASKVGFYYQNIPKISIPNTSCMLIRSPGIASAIANYGLLDELAALGEDDDSVIDINGTALPQSTIGIK